MNIDTGKRITDWKPRKKWTEECGCIKQSLTAEYTNGTASSSQYLKICKEHQRIFDIEDIIGKLESEKKSLEKQIRERT